MQAGIINFAVAEKGPAQLANTDIFDNFNTISSIEDKSKISYSSPFSSASSLIEAERPARIGFRFFLIASSTTIRPE